MKQLFNTLLCLLWAFAAQAQAEFAAVDTLARSIQKDDYPTPEALSKALCKDLTTDRDKARVLFTWIAENIRYDFGALDRKAPQGISSVQYQEQLIRQTYRRGRGICMDYALLYKRMADAAGLECVYIGGHSKSSVLGGWAGHAWNAVKINGKWELLDATWGSGYRDGEGKFRQVFQPGYFLTPPRLFALNHFPDDERWQLLDTPIDKREFRNQPAFSYGDPVNGITNSEPFGLPLAKGADGKVELRLQIQRRPSVIQLKMGERVIEYELSEKDGWLTLRFVPAYGRQLQVWAGERKQNGVLATLIGVFPME